MLSNIIVQPAFDIHELLRILNELGQRLQTTDSTVDLLIVDSIASLALPALSSSHDQGVCLDNMGPRGQDNGAHREAGCCAVRSGRAWAHRCAPLVHLTSAVLLLLLSALPWLGPTTPGSSAQGTRCSPRPGAFSCR